MIGFLNYDNGKPTKILVVTDLANIKAHSFGQLHCYIIIDNMPPGSLITSKKHTQAKKNNKTTKKHAKLTKMILLTRKTCMLPQ